MNKRSISYTAAIAASLASVAILCDTAKAAVIINEAYGGGGNSGSTFTNDFIELYNNGTAPVDISGFQIAYASATGTFTPSATETNFVTTIPANTFLAVGGFYLIQEAAGAGGTTALPNVNLVDTTAIALSGTTFKLQLLAAASATAAVQDLVAVGPTATPFEGLGPAPIISNTLSAQRLVDGVDTNNNNVDFGTGAPTPAAVNVAVAAVPEPASLALIGLAGLGALRRRRA